MKKIILILFLFPVMSSLNAQEKKIYIEDFTINDQLIHGVIDEKYSVTMYLTFEQYSYETGMFYSVSGWYYYDNIKKKIPLVGIYSGGLTLYSFADQARADSIKKLASPVSNPWESVDELMNRSGFTEKFYFEYSDYQYKGTWENSQKKLGVSFSTSDINLDKAQSFLVIPVQNNGKKRLDLRQLGPMNNGYSVFASRYDAAGSKVLLKYSVSSTANPNGMCGAGYEIGYILLVFDSKGTLSDYRLEDVESCLGNFWSETTEVPNTSGKKLICKVTNSEDKVRTVTIDGVNFTLVSK
ncbi:hypothetical protein [Fluviicola taffensis]|uniref:hypothetical protein n=1 Tax=Fluviicola taffensis TaxID=191579 RepID=UPI00313841BD